MIKLESIEKILVEGRIDEAIRLLEEYITSAPEPSDRAYYLLGNAHRKKGDWQLAINNPVGVIFSGIFMAMLDIVGMQLTNLTAYNEYITDVIISVIVYLSAFSLVIRMMLVNIRKRREMKKATVTTAPVPPEAQAQPLDAPEETPPDPDGEQEKGGEDA